ncbi:unnamed protein product, partial [Rotaria sp. Silwood1]
NKISASSSQSDVTQETLTKVKQKCLILPEDISYIWSTILNSMAKMPYDAVKYKSKINHTIKSTTVTCDPLTKNDIVRQNETVH